MPTDVLMPQMGESIFEGTITKWLKQPGDRVIRDEPLFEISTDKVDAEIPAPSAGVLKEIRHKEGETVKVNTVVGVIDESGAAVAAPPLTAKRPALSPPPAKLAPPPAVQPQPQAKSAGTAPAGPAIEVVMPQMGESIFEGTITKWLKKAGDKVTARRAAL